MQIQFHWIAGLLNYYKLSHVSRIRMSERLGLLRETHLWVLRTLIVLAPAPLLSVQQYLWCRKLQTSELQTQHTICSEDHQLNGLKTRLTLWLRVSSQTGLYKNVMRTSFVHFFIPFRRRNKIYQNCSVSSSLAIYKDTEIETKRGKKRLFDH